VANDFSIRKKSFLKKSLYLQAAIRKIGDIKRRLGETSKREARQIVALKRLIEESKHNGKETIVVLASWFERENDADGYVQRVRSIDQMALCGSYRVYISNKGLQAKKISIVRVDGNHAEVLINQMDPQQREKVRALIDQCGSVYVHSIYRLRKQKWDLWPLFENKGILKIWDVHGAVPEELSLHGGLEECDKAEEVERYAYERADVIVTVNHAMEVHLRTKYGDTRARIVTLPIFSKSIRCGKETPLANEGGKPTVVYAGGLQPWQNAEHMQEVVERTCQWYSYRFFVPHPEELAARWEFQNVTISTLAFDRMEEGYDECQYGLLFRDDIVINNVACPTKLIEYLQYGIVPVLISPRVGDFVDLGMRYVPYDDFSQGKLPSAEERARMVESNQMVLRKLEEEFIAGCEEIRRMVKKSG